MNTTPTPTPAIFAGRKGTPSQFAQVREMPKFERKTDSHLQYRPFAGLEGLLKSTN